MDANVKLTINGSDGGVSDIRRMTLINEAAVYKLAFRSNKPEADRFVNWVTGTVLPSIRRTGSYSISNNRPESTNRLPLPKGFRKVQARGIRWKVKEKKSTFLPQFSQFSYFLVSMYARIVKHDERIFLYVQGKGVKVFNDLVRVNTFSRGEPIIAVVPVYHAEDVDPL